MTEKIKFEDEGPAEGWDKWISGRESAGFYNPATRLSHCEPGSKADPSETLVVNIGRGTALRQAPGIRHTPAPARI
jgi:hypothetical protein